MFTIEGKGIFHKKNRLVASTKLAEADFHKVADRIGRKPFKARKIGFVAARKAEQIKAIETRWNGKESTDTAQPGDWIVTNLSPDLEVLRDKAGNENTYVINAPTFSHIYEAIIGRNEFGQFFKAKNAQFFKAKNAVDAVYLSGGFDILAPWGQQQTAGAGYLLLNGGDVYGDNANTFDATYEIVH